MHFKVLQSQKKKIIAKNISSHQKMNTLRTISSVLCMVFRVCCPIIFYFFFFFWIRAKWFLATSMSCHRTTAISTVKYYIPNEFIMHRKVYVTIRRVGGFVQQIRFIIINHNTYAGQRHKHTYIKQCATSHPPALSLNNRYYRCGCEQYTQFVA